MSRYRLKATEKVKTKRPANNLIFYDGSVELPRRIWPPIGTPPNSSRGLRDGRHALALIDAR